MDTVRSSRFGFMGHACEFFCLLNPNVPPLRPSARSFAHHQAFVLLVFVWTASVVWVILSTTHSSSAQGASDRHVTCLQSDRVCCVYKKKVSVPYAESDSKKSKIQHHRKGHLFSFGFSKCSMSEFRSTERSQWPFWPPPPSSPCLPGLA